MRLGLIGMTGHWQTYVPALKNLPEVTLTAVAKASPEETLQGFGSAPGITPNTHRYEDPQEMLHREQFDIVQVCCRPDLTPKWTRVCLEQGIPVVAEKPLAMDLQTLREIYEIAKKNGVPVIPMHTMRESGELAAVREAVRSGKVGVPLLISNQKTYKWGTSRPDFFRSRKTFPGVAPYIGIHVFDWLHWILGDVYTEVMGRESVAARKDYPACASHATYMLKAKGGGLTSITVDYLRPPTAPTHNDERVRVVGTEGILEMILIESKMMLTTQNAPMTLLPSLPQEDIFTAFVRSLKKQAESPLTLQEAFRITEIALKTQQAVDTGRSVSLLRSPFL